MLRWLYIRLLRAHPAVFRQRFGHEMLEAFDLSIGPGEHWQLVLDGMVSLARQWILRPEFRQPWQPAASAPASRILSFQQIEPYKPHGIALTEGGLMAVLLIVGVVNAINLGGGKAAILPIGMQRPGYGIFKLSRADFEGQPWIAVDAAKDREDPQRPFARSYFRALPVLAALDADGDLTISVAEIANAPAALRALDRNHDGKLSAEECGFLPPGDFNGPPRLLESYRRDFMNSVPVLAVLATDRSGEISAAAIASAAEKLQSLDLDRNGSLSPYEVLPHPALSEAAGIVGRFDIAEGGVIPVQGTPKEDVDAAFMKRLLAAADRNRDGVVTRGELILEMSSVREIHRLQ
jgi:Ca2+-binding EF-hand superfamily protein